MIDIELLRKSFPLLDQGLLEALSDHAVLKEIPQGVEIMKEGHPVKMIPLVIKGLVKVFSRYEDKELLLYCRTPGAAKPDICGHGAGCYAGPVAFSTS